MLCGVEWTFAALAFQLVAVLPPRVTLEHHMSYLLTYTDKPIYYYQIGKRIQYIHLMSNGSRNSSLSFIENFQNG